MYNLRAVKQMSILVPLSILSEVMFIENSNEYLSMSSLTDFQEWKCRRTFAGV